MGRYSRVGVVYRKELLDTLRDRRTLAAMVLVPIVLYPVLMIVLVEALRSEKGRREAGRYSVCVPDEAAAAWLRDVFMREDAARDAAAAAATQVAEAAGRTAAAAGDELRAQVPADQIDIAVADRGASLWDLVDRKQCHVGVIVNPSPAGQSSASSKETRGGQSSALSEKTQGGQSSALSNEPPTASGPETSLSYPGNRIVQLVYRDTEPLSEFLAHQLSRTLAAESERILAERVTALHGGPAVLTPVLVNAVSTAGPEQQHAKILSMIVPFLLVVMTVTGAMYPAIDLTAGERERGTLETLAVSPAPVGQIVAGKFGVILTIALLSTVLNLGSMTAMIHFTRLDQLAGGVTTEAAVEQAGVEAEIESVARTGGTAARAQLENLDRRRELEQAAATKPGFLTTAAPIVLLAMIPFAVLFSAVMLAVCSFARTFKEAQNYMMPVMMCAVIPAMVVSYMPSIKLAGMIQVVPVANVVLLIRELFLGNYAWSAMSIAILSTGLYAVAAVAVAARIYGAEAVLFSDVGSYKTLLRRRYFKPRPHPSAAGALLVLAVIFPANFYWQSALLDPAASSGRTQAVMAASQVFVLAAPVLALAWYLKLDLRRTFSLRAPSAAHVGGAALVAVAAWPMSDLLLRIQSLWWPISADSTQVFKQLEQMLLAGSPVMVLVTIALLPGICEELLFRGFMLSGLRSRLGDVRAVVTVGVLFGLFHIYVEKIPTVALMGMLLAVVCLRTGSIYLAMLVHVVHNGMPVLAHYSAFVRRAYGVVETETVPAGVDLDLHKVAFLAMFAVGLLVIGVTRPRTASSSS